MTKPYYYREMGTRDKKTGKLPWYRVKVVDFKVIDCNCKAREFRQHSPCKHMKNLQSKNSILSL